MKLTAISGGWLFAIALAAAAGLTGCADSPAGPGAQAGADGLLISEPVRSGAALVAGDTEDLALAYISASPGTFPDGISATITNLANGEAVTVEIVDGGLDPVALKASPSNELEITFRNRDGGFTTFRAFVPDRKRPRIVRTRPPKDATDVVLAFSPLVVVFSEPVDRSTVTHETIMLLADGVPVDVTIEVRVDGLLAQVTPTAYLAPQTNYTLVVTTELLDSNGDLLEARFEASFNTESPPPTQLMFIIQPEATHANQPLTPAVEVAIQDLYGNTITGATGPITLALGTNPVDVDGTLSGTTTVSAVAGIARFSDLRIERPGSGYTLVATSGSLRSATSTQFDIFLDFASVSAGNLHTCGLTVTGNAHCWGFNDFGQLGDGSTTGSLTPVLVSGGIRFSSISTKGGHTCGVTSVGEAYCWGENFSGELGDGTTINRLTPMLVSGGLSFASVSSSFSETCGVTTGGDAYCWGENFSGQLGDGTTINRLTPVPVAGGLTFASLSTASHTCGLTAAGDTYCWGDNRGGMLGDGTTTNRLTPVRVAGGLGFASLNTGNGHTCGVTADGDTYCWGNNGSGQLGDGSTIHRLTPVLVSGGLSFASVSAGGSITCGVTTARDAYCWGNNSSGQLGNGTTTDRHTPVPVEGGLSFASVNNAALHTCAVTTAGVAYCWGFNSDGQLGDGSTTNRLTPVRVIQ